MGDRLQNGSPYAIGPLSVCPVLFVCLSVCNVVALWPNGLTDQDETWHAGRPRPWPHCIRWGPSPPNFRPMFIIVIVISLEHGTGVRRYWFVQVQVQVLVFYAFYF